MSPEDLQHTVVLTPHPLQRIGAYALAALAGVGTVAELTPDLVRAQVDKLRQDVRRTADVEKSQDPRGFWLGVSYLMWPNSGMNTTNRGKQKPAERREAVDRWRVLPPYETWPAVPCALCGRPACGFYGKVDVALAASVAQRNTTPPGHAGLALCYACLTCYHALPYGCAIGGGRAAALHSWDDDFLAAAAADQVRKTRRDSMLAPGTSKRGPYFREVTALNRLRSYTRELTAGVDLMVFSNSNKEQFLDVHTLEQPLAEWLRTHARPGPGFAHLVRAHATKDIPGLALLARNAFIAPARVFHRAVRYLTDRPEGSALLHGGTQALVPLCLSYATEVLHVRQTDIDRLDVLAGNIAGQLEERREKGALKSFEAAYREGARLRTWLRQRAVAWTLAKGGAETPFVTDQQWLLLFDSEGRNRLHQEVLLIKVLGKLVERGWAAEDVTPDDIDELTPDSTEDPADSYASEGDDR